MQNNNKTCQEIIEPALKSDGKILSAMAMTLESLYETSIYGVSNEAPISELTQKIYLVSVAIAEYSLVLPLEENRHEKPILKILREVSQRANGESIEEEQLLPRDLYKEYIAYCNVLLNTLEINDPSFLSEGDKSDLTVMQNEHQELVALVRLMKKTADNMLQVVEVLWKKTYN